MDEILSHLKTNGPIGGGPGRAFEYFSLGDAQKAVEFWTRSPDTYASKLAQNPGLDFEIPLTLNGIEKVLSVIQKLRQDIISHDAELNDIINNYLKTKPLDVTDWRSDPNKLKNHMIRSYSKKVIMSVVSMTIYYEANQYLTLIDGVCSGDARKENPIIIFDKMVTKRLDLAVNNFFAQSTVSSTTVQQGIKKVLEISAKESNKSTFLIFVGTERFLDKLSEHFKNNPKDRKAYLKACNELAKNKIMLDKFSPQETELFNQLHDQLKKLAFENSFLGKISKLITTSPKKETTAPTSSTTAPTSAAPEKSTTKLTESSSHETEIANLAKKWQQIENINISKDNYFQFSNFQKQLSDFMFKFGENTKCMNIADNYFNKLNNKLHPATVKNWVTSTPKKVENKAAPEAEAVEKNAPSKIIGDHRGAINQNTEPSSSISILKGK